MKQDKWYLGGYMLGLIAVLVIEAALLVGTIALIVWTLRWLGVM